MLILFFAFVVLILICFGVYIFFLVCRPHKLVALYARFSRHYYKSYRKMTDEEIDSISLWPWDPFLIRPLSQFIEIAPREPRKYARLVQAYRVLGIFLFLIWSMLVISVMCIMSQGYRF